MTTADRASRKGWASRSRRAKAEDLANHEVAERLGGSERTVRRILERLRARSEAALSA